MFSHRALKSLLLVFSVNATVSVLHAQTAPAGMNPEELVAQLERDWLGADAKEMFRGWARS